MIIKILEELDIPLMKDVLADDKMIYNRDNLKSFVNDQKNYGIIAKINDKIIGFAYAYCLLRPDGKKMFYLHSIGILPKYQDQGIGTKLLQYIIDYAQKNKFSEVFVITDKGNAKACHIYEKTGGKNDIANEVVYVYDFIKE